MSVLYDFGGYRLDTAKRVLTRNGEVVPLAPKTFDLLVLLLESGGRALSKNDLMHKLWSDTFVEEANLSFQISTLRKALGEDGPKWIETLPKHGYRFAAPVTEVISTEAPQASPPALISEEAEPDRPRLHHKLWSIGIATVCVIALALYFTTINRRTSNPTAAATPDAPVPLTTYPGFQVQPSLSPDGSQVAFSWNGPNEENYDIYVKLVGPGEPVRLTRDPARDINPAWSPDGRFIAFLRLSSEHEADIFLIPALGGAERKVGAVLIFPDSRPRDSNLTWSVDGKYIAFGGKFAEGELPGIWLISVDSGERRRLTTSPEGMTDFSPVFAPDAGSMAFVRSLGLLGDIYLQRLTTVLAADGAPRRVTFGNNAILSVGWTGDGRKVAYSTGIFPGLQRIHTIEVDPLLAQPGAHPDTAHFGEGATALNISHSGRLVYAREFRDSNIWQLRTPVTGAARPVRLIASTLDDMTPDYSPDGQRIAFESTRSGYDEIWVARADGSEPLQVTTTRSQHTSNARWFSDGRKILFNSWHPLSDLYIIDVRNGTLRPITDDPADEIEPTWSRDGKWIYYASNRTGRWEVYRMPAAGGASARITKDGGVSSHESVDRTWLYYAKSAESPTEIWKVPVSGGQEIKVLEGLSYSLNFVATDKGIYFMSVGYEANQTAIEFYDFATSRRELLFTLNKPWFYGMSISPDQHSLVYSVIDHAGSNLMLIDNFR